MLCKNVVCTYNQQSPLQSFYTLEKYLRIQFMDQRLLFSTHCRVYPTYFATQKLHFISYVLDCSNCYMFTVPKSCLKCIIILYIIIYKNKSKSLSIKHLEENKLQTISSLFWFNYVS